MAYVAGIFGRKGVPHRSGQGGGGTVRHPAGRSRKMRKDRPVSGQPPQDRGKESMLPMWGSCWARRRRSLRRHRHGGAGPLRGGYLHPGARVISSIGFPGAGSITAGGCLCGNEITKCREAGAAAHRFRGAPQGEGTGGADGAEPSKMRAERLIHQLQHLRRCPAQSGQRGKKWKNGAFQASVRCGIGLPGHRPWPMSRRTRTRAWTPWAISPRERNALRAPIRKSRPVRVP